MAGISSGSISSHLLRGDGYRTTTINERLVLNTVRLRREATQADLARSSGLTGQSIMRIVDALKARGLIEEGPPMVSGRGKPGRPLRLVPDAAFSVGISIMTDALTILLVDFAGTVRAVKTERMLDVQPEAGILQLRSMIDAVVAETAIDRNRLAGAGVGITGYFVDSTARVNPPVQLEPWALIPLDTLLSEGLGMPVWIDNDGNVAAVGEAMLGAAQHVRTFSYLYFSAGFGGGLYVNGRLERGRSGNAGEYAASIPLDWPQPNLEQLRLHVNAAGGELADVNALVESFAADLPGLDAWMPGAIRSLNLVVSSISAILDPDLIVLGGRIPRLLAEMIIPQLAFINPPRREYPRPVPRIVPSSVNYDATALGAAAMPLLAAFFQ